MVLSNFGLQVQLPIVKVRASPSHFLALLSCRINGSELFVGIMLAKTKTTSIHALFDPQTVGPSVAHTITVDSRVVAEASTQDLTIAHSSRFWQYDIDSGQILTHILVSQNKRLSTCKFFISDAKAVWAQEGRSTTTLDSFWEPANYELVARDGYFNEESSHIRISCCGSCMATRRQTRYTGCKFAAIVESPLLASGEKSCMIRRNGVVVFGVNARARSSTRLLHCKVAFPR